VRHANHTHPFSQYNTPNIYTNQTVEGLYTSTKYSFQACVDSCDEWNAAHAVAAKPCMALSYYANLTNVFTEHQEWQGNCILKSGVGGVTTNITTSTDSGMDWAHTARFVFPIVQSCRTRVTKLTSLLVLIERVYRKGYRAKYYASTCPVANDTTLVDHASLSRPAFMDGE